MKISFNPSINNKQVNNLDKDKNQVNTVNNTEIQKNSMAETIGRSQVSFGATNKSNRTIFEHSCGGKFGFTEKDVITYNKETGSLKHEIYRTNGKLRETQEFFPFDRSEIITTIDEDGKKVIKTTTPEFYQIEKTDSKGREIFLRNEDYTNGELYTRTTDYKRQRCVERTQKDKSSPEVVQVTDLRTNTLVTTGELVSDKRFDKQTNTYITENIVTKQVLETEQLKSNGKLLKYVTYVEGSGLVSSEKTYDASTGGYEERIYSGMGRNHLVKKITTSKDGRIEHIKEYEADGITEKSSVRYFKLKSGDLDRIEAYFPGTSKIDYEEDYYDSSYIRTEYSKSPNVPQKQSEYTYDTNILLNETIFYNDGKTKFQYTEYKENGSYNVSTFTAQEILSKVERYSSDDFLNSVEEYNTRTGYRVKLNRFDRNNGCEYWYMFNPNTGKLTKASTYNRNGDLEETTEYYQDGKTPRIKANYNFDGSYTETRYNEDGTIKSRIEFDKYGRKKEPNYEYKRQQTHSTSYSQQKQTTETEAEFLKRIGDITANTQARIIDEFKTSDWQRLASILGVNNVESIQHMDRATYKKLAMSFHPDRFPDNEEAQKRGEKLFQIINNIYEQQ